MQFPESVHSLSPEHYDIAGIPAYTHASWVTYEQILPKNALCCTIGRVNVGEYEFFVGDGIHKYVDLPKIGRLIGTPSVTETENAIVKADLTGNLTGWSAAILAAAEEAMPYSTLDSDRLYGGTDLAVKFASEITSHTDVWAWLKARVTAANYKGLHIGDYVQFTMGADTIRAQIAGLDTYYRTGDVELGHHIDFISKDCLTQTYQWNTTDINNGSDVNAAPWMVSALKASLDGLVTSLPAGLQAVITDKRAFLETRYTSGSTLTSSTGWAWNNMGKLWIPSEHEVFGVNIWSTPKYASGQAVQYPIFANSYKGRVKGTGHNGTRCYWWLASVYSGGSTRCCTVIDGGHPYTNAASTALGVPLCFRIA